MAKPEKDPLRTGILGVFTVACLVLISFGYTGLPFWPQGKNYSAFFNDAGGITPGSDVRVSGIKVGKVGDVELSGTSAKVNFTVERQILVGDQSLVSIKTDTVLGQKSLWVTPKGAKEATVIPLGRTTTPYTINTALQDLGENSSELDKPQMEQALKVLTDTLHDANPQLRGALDGVATLSRSLNKRDQALEQLLGHAKKVSDTLAQRADQVNKLVTDGNQLFAALDQRREALGTLISGIRGVSQQLSGFVADNKREFGPALKQLNLLMDQLLQRKEHISEALKRLPGYATALGEVVGNGPGFNINLYGLPPATMTEVLLDTYFQPGKLPASLGDMLRGYISERIVVRPKSP
ncbi:MCE family protein [Mycobacterium sp. CBMA293]|uniref:MCE family protein n=1 Tax=unclassified Mycolicibacterium TaxID=2636767 RepID=UPI0012DFC53D|nr:MULTISPECIES: MCE family protein [unclassified Mycolicibacterium]MUL44371.1 MCE family protein [Mycolicibacterium sp. CBMA 360]MUL59689.1 MCE family protein [Mycolicibacterium sp. CBMA 335]MUL68532.1 MCE family protein [Mycolicibacterium sp. CBMA 311]MUL97185.1 MCE family protein [Mycolicibacterium sp. CBMA 230]MUM06323.1 mammalian cell entry protein [Mycolicibacterium sp. CBMA 213]